MTKKSHNKKRNVGIIYELLLATYAQGMVESNSSKVNKSQKIIKRYFREGSELYKEHRLFRALVEPEINDGSLATKILAEAKKACRTHNVQRLEREKSRLIKEINYAFGKDFYNKRIDNYTDFATVQTLLNDWRMYNDADFNRVTLFENKVHSILTKPKADIALDTEKNKEVDNLVFKLMTQKFNEKYSRELGDLQQLLIKQYVFLENGDSSGFKSTLQEIKKTTINNIIAYENECDNKHVLNKINEVKSEIKALDINNLNDQTMAKFLTLCDLSKEIKRGE